MTVYFLEKGPVHVYQSRVCPCPPKWPAGCYWYGGSRNSSGKLPRWVDQLLEKPYVEPEQRTVEEDLGMDSEEDGDLTRAKITEPEAQGRMQKRRNPNLL